MPHIRIILKKSHVRKDSELYRCVQIGIVHVALFDVPSVFGVYGIQQEHDVPKRFSDNKYANSCEFLRAHRAVAGITLRSRAPVIGDCFESPGTTVFSIT